MMSIMLISWFSSLQNEIEVKVVVFNDDNDDDA